MKKIISIDMHTFLFYLHGMIHFISTSQICSVFLTSQSDLFAVPHRHVIELKEIVS